MRVQGTWILVVYIRLTKLAGPAVKFLDIVSIHNLKPRVARNVLYGKHLKHRVWTEITACDVGQRSPRVGQRSPRIGQRSPRVITNRQSEKQ